MKAKENVLFFPLAKDFAVLNHEPLITTWRPEIFMWEEKSLKLSVKYITSVITFLIYLDYQKLKRNKYTLNCAFKHMFVQNVTRVDYM